MVEAGGAENPGVGQEAIRAPEHEANSVIITNIQLAMIAKKENISRTVNCYNNKEEAKKNWPANNV